MLAVREGSGGGVEFGDDFVGRADAAHELIEESEDGEVAFDAVESGAGVVDEGDNVPPVDGFDGGHAEATVGELAGHDEIGDLKVVEEAGESGGGEGAGGGFLLDDFTGERLHAGQGLAVGVVDVAGQRDGAALGEGGVILLVL